MPVYEYQCPLQHRTEINRAPEAANEPAFCSECGAPARRLFKLRGIAFKGPGFYATDSRPQVAEQD